MKIQTYKKINAVLFATMFLCVGLALWSRQAFIAFLAIGCYMALISLLKTRIRGILADERQIAVAQKASEISFKILLPLLLFASVALFAGGGKQEFYYVRALGIVLSYITSLGSLIYFLTFLYFNKISGGNIKND